MTTATADAPFVTRRQAAALLKVSVKTADRLLKAKGVPAVRHDHTVRYRTADILALPDRQPPTETPTHG